MNQRINGFLTRLEREKITTTNVFVDMLCGGLRDRCHEETLQQKYHEVPAGFEIQKNIHLRSTDPRILDRIVTAAAK